MAKREKPPRPTSAELEAALAERRSHRRFRVFCDYSVHHPDPADLPILRRALNDPEFRVANAAAFAIGKLRGKAAEVVEICSR